MTKHDFDILCCHWPILWALLTWILRANSIPLLIFFALGYFGSLIYAFFRLAQQKWSAGRVIGWGFGLFFVNIIFLPLFYWLHLREQDSH